MSKPWLSILVMTCTLGACESHGLRYQATPQPPGANISANYILTEEALTISIDTNGGQLEQAYIRKPDGTLVYPINIVRSGITNRPTPGVKPASEGPTLYVAPGVKGTIAPTPSAPQPAQPLTTPIFPQAAGGPAPWELHLKIEALPETIIPQLGEAQPTSSPKTNYP